MTSGFTEPGLQRLNERMREHIEGGEAPGIVTALQRDGEAVIHATGVQDLETGVPMAPDTMFQLVAMTKPFTATVMLQLIEEGILNRDDHIAAWLPELATPRVLRSIGSELEDTVPANRPITLHDVMTCRLGTGVVLSEPGTYPIQDAQGEADAARADGGDAWIRAMGSLPLIHQPGEGWMYHTGDDVLGLLIERVTGKRLGDIFSDRVFGPLGMSDTAYYVPGDKRQRLATEYEFHPETGDLMVSEGFRDRDWSTPPPFQTGGSGLVSTAPDLLAFGRMLLGMGTLGGVRILAGESVQEMTTDHIPATAKRASPGYGDFLGDDGWGHGVAIVNHKDRFGRSAGSYGWMGGANTHWHNDPAHDLTGLLLFQRHFTRFDDVAVRSDFWPLAYAAIDG
jgi:CubicO group peptidase (beta-lactamase class C family)